MRRAQSSIEVVLAATLLAMVLSASGLGALAAWRSAEVAVAKIAAKRASARGGDPRQAADDVVPMVVRGRPRPAWQATR